jgi:transcriptional repressor NrdR
VRCPFCKAEDTRVTDTRGGDGQAIRRRRKCDACGRRFTTYERVELNLPMVVKKHGERQPFDVNKVRKGIERACHKRPIGAAALDALAYAVEGHFAEQAEREVTSGQVGAVVLRRLREVDEVAYVRFASVYRDFSDLSQFLAELQDLAEAARLRDTAPPEQRPNSSSLPDPLAGASADESADWSQDVLKP